MMNVTPREEITDEGLNPPLVHCICVHVYATSIPNGDQRKDRKAHTKAHSKNQPQKCTPGPVSSTSTLHEPSAPVYFFLSSQCPGFFPSAFQHVSSKPLNLAFSLSGHCCSLSSLSISSPQEWYPSSLNAFFSNQLQTDFYCDNWTKLLQSKSVIISIWHTSLTRPIAPSS